MLNFKASWAQPVLLTDGAFHGLTYWVKNMKSVPENPGAYVFARVHGKRVVPLYIGETANLRKRLEQHPRRPPKIPQLWPLQIPPSERLMTM